MCGPVVELASRLARVIVVLAGVALASSQLLRAATQADGRGHHTRRGTQGIRHRHRPAWYRPALLRLARLLRELHQADQALAPRRCGGERLRVARDPHDLLGHQLAAILLKAEVAKRLAVSDPGRSDAELRQLGSLAGKTSQELRCQAAAED